MTIDGTIRRTAILLLLAVMAAASVWSRSLPTRRPREFLIWLLLGLLAQVAIALPTILKPSWARITGPIYALMQGLCLGALSGALELRYPGIAIQTVALTFGTGFSLLAAFRLRIIRVTEQFRLGVLAAMGGIVIVRLAGLILGFVGIRAPIAPAGGGLGIIIGIFVVSVAALNLVVDFDFVKRGAEARAPKYMEWYAAFALILTLVWLYLEVLNLLAKARDSRMSDRLA
jgi:uncharacterized YccA/Bax inhibitor family protein